MKDKKNALLDIFAMLKKFVKVDVDSNPETNKSKPNENRNTEGASAASEGEKNQSFSCLSCKFKADNIESLNKHNRDDHIRT